nr:immunoglobulin heavy chain junction region [Macaca mulatta]MOW87704.1 immunoglobulin heavy chain junction region [Macaca mulatta]MOW90066.1 immunoglobulin heavy chain junction region [Macaca mulatta]MOW90667.1 immunoglobulin heavy chain junction region [Macaca mulatta]
CVRDYTGSLFDYW